MIFTYAKGISPQGRSLYTLLNKKGVLSAQDIANELNIHPNAVYRLADYLKSIGLIEEVVDRPKRFRALSPKEGLENYLTYQRAQLDEKFACLAPPVSILPSQDYHVSFMQGRKEIFREVASDLDKAKKEAKFIVLGLPIGVSPELMLAQKNAVERGVSIRIIAQEYLTSNRETLRSWKKIGLDVRLGQPIGFHLLLIDNTISYLMYYDAKDKTKRYSVRIVHQAINKQLQAIFDKYWLSAKSLRL